MDNINLSCLILGKLNLKTRLQIDKLYFDVAIILKNHLVPRNNIWSDPVQYNQLILNHGSHYIRYWHKTNPWLQISMARSKQWISVWLCSKKITLKCDLNVLFSLSIFLSISLNLLKNLPNIQIWMYVSCLPSRLLLGITCETYAYDKES